MKIKHYRHYAEILEEEPIGNFLSEKEAISQVKLGTTDCEFDTIKERKNKVPMTTLSLLLS